MDRDTAFAIPHEVVSRNIEHCSRTERENGKSYWHIALSHNEAGNVVWNLTRVQKKIDLSDWEFPLRLSKDVTSEEPVPLQLIHPSSGR